MGWNPSVRPVFACLMNNICKLLIFDSGAVLGILNEIRSLEPSLGNDFRNLDHLRIKSENKNIPSIKNREI